MRDTRRGDVSVLALRVFVDELVRRRVDPMPLLEAAGLTTARLEDPFGRVPRGRVVNLVEAAWRATHDRFFHVAAVVATEIGAFGIADYVATMAPTVGLGVERVAVAYALVNSGLRIVPRVGPSRVRLMLEPACEPRPHPADVETFAAAAATRIRRATGGRHGPCAITFSGPDRGYAERFAARVGCPVIYEAAVDAVVIERAAWDARPEGSHPAVVGLVSAEVDPLARTAVDPDDRPRGLVGEVERLVGRGLRHGAACAHEVARALGLSERTLHRRLADEGVRFGELLDDVRRRVADHHLTEGRLRIAAIAELLGFSEPGAFTRAYRRWTGHAPSDARRGAVPPESSV